MSEKTSKKTTKATTVPDYEDVLDSSNAAKNAGNQVGSSRGMFSFGGRGVNKGNEGCAAELFSFLAFGGLLFIFILIGDLVVEQGNIPGDVRDLQVGTPLSSELSGGKQDFFNLQLDAGTIYAIATTNTDEDLDTILTLIRRPDKIITFNDDVASDNLNSLIINAPTQNEEVVVKVNSFEGKGNGKYTLSAVAIEEKLTVGEFTTEAVEGGGIFLSTVSLVEGTVYEIYAFDPTLDFFEFDSSIRVRDLNGREIIEAFQSSISEQSAQLMFTATRTGLFIVEVRRTQRSTPFNATVLVFEANVEQLDMDFEGTQTFSNKDLLSTTSTIFQVDLKADEQYEFDIDLAFDNVLTDERNTFGQLIGLLNPETNLIKFYSFTSVGLVPGVTIRAMNKENNRVDLRTRTDFDFNFSVINEIPYADGNVYFENLLDTTPLGTSFELTPLVDSTILLDISRMNPDFTFTNGQNFANIRVAQFDLTITNKGILDDSQIIKLNELVDQDNLFANCDVDQVKYSITDGCDAGVVLFCRNEFFPKLLTDNATKKEFAEICECTDFLCATLPSGVSLGDGFENFLKLCYGIFASFAFIGLIIYGVATFDLVLFGGIQGWMERGFWNWTLASVFFLTSAIFFVTQIQLSNEITTMDKIATNFDLTRIPVPADSLEYSYYDTIFSSKIDLGRSIPDANESDLDFLNREALDAIPKALTFDTLRTRVLVNMISFVLMQAVAVICSLDISIVWIESARSTGLNRKNRKRRFRRFKMIVRSVEATYFITLLGIAISLAVTNGSSYSVVNSVLVFMLALSIVVLYAFGRSGLKSILQPSYMITVDPNVGKEWRIVRNVSTVIIGANVGIMITQLYKMARIQDFSDLVAANNDSVSLSLLLFQDSCLFAGMSAIHYYEFQLYQRYRKSLFDFGEDFDDGEEELRKLKSVEATEFQTNPSKKFVTKEVRKEIPQESEAISSLI